MGHKKGTFPGLHLSAAKRTYQCFKCKRMFMEASDRDDHLIWVHAHDVDLDTTGVHNRGAP